MLESTETKVKCFIHGLKTSKTIREYGVSTENII